MEQEYTRNLRVCTKAKQIGGGGGVDGIFNTSLEVAIFEGVA